MSTNTNIFATSVNINNITDARPQTSAGQQTFVLIFTLVLTDALMLICAFLLAYWLRFKLQVSIAPEVVPSSTFYTSLGMVLMPLWLFLFGLYGLYKKENLLGGTIEYSRVFNACTTGMTLVVVTAFLEPRFYVARGWLVSAWVLSVVFLFASRFLIRRVVYTLRKRGCFLIPVVIVGCNGEARSVAKQLMGEPSSGYHVLGLVNSGHSQSQLSTAQSGKSPSVLGRLDEIESIVARLQPKEVIVAASSLERGELLALLQKAQSLPGVEIRMSTGLYEVLTTGVRVTTVASVPFISINRLRLTILQSATKTVLEYGIAVATLAIFMPVLIMIAVMIKRDSSGPVFHRRRVLGLGGKQFYALKFRTMYVTGDEMLESQPELKDKLRHDGKLKKDPRITPVGAFLRRYSLDELPQLLNVLRGQMSLVGPRMISPEEVKWYGRYKINLLTVKPGMTGLWQVSGRSNLNYEERVRLDMHYVRNYSIWLDLQILFVRTPVAVFSGCGAY